MRILLFKEDGDVLNDKGDDYLCIKCLNTLLEKVDDGYFRCPYYSCSASFFEEELNIIARKEQ